MKRTYFMVFVLLIANSALAVDQAPVLEIKLNDSVSEGVANSGRLDSAEAETQAASSKAHSQESLL